MSTSGSKPLCVGLGLSPTWLRWQSETSDSGSNNTATYHAKFYVELAQQAERAYIDFVFKPDSLWLNLLNDREAVEANKANKPNALTAHQLYCRQGALDPSVIATTIAAHTQHIGIVTTISTTFNEPYIVARQLMSMNWMSQGRIGWNVVTSLDGQENFGLEKMPDANNRYARASEFVSVVQKLWDSFTIAGSPSANDITNNITNNTTTKPKLQGLSLLDKQFVNASSSKNVDSGNIKVNRVKHFGEYFKVAGPLNVPAYPNSKIAMFQAGASAVGKQFASSIADAVFAATPSLLTATKLRAELHRLAESQNRTYPLKLLPGLYFFIRDSKDLAYEAYLQAHAHLSTGQRLQKILDIVGADLTHKALTDTIRINDLPSPDTKVRSLTHALLLRDYISRNTPTLLNLLNRPEVISSGHWTVFGTVDQIASMIIFWATQDAIDGFIALPGDDNSLQRFFTELMPYLIKQGYCRSSYDNKSFTERLRSN